MAEVVAEAVLETSNQDDPGSSLVVSKTETVELVEDAEHATAVAQVTDFELASNLLGLAQGEYIVLQMPAEEEENEATLENVKPAANRINHVVSTVKNEDPDYVPGRDVDNLNKRTRKTAGGSHIKKMKLFSYAPGGGNYDEKIIELQLIEVEPDKSGGLEEVELAARSFVEQQAVPAVAMRPGSLGAHAGKDRLACHTCGKVFNNKSNLSAHVMIHTDVRPYPCPRIGCGKSFRTKEAGRRHYAAHNGEKAFECEVCQKKFSSNHGLKEHVTIHMNTKMYKCTECQKEFRQLSSLSRHQTVHSGVKRYTCEICQKTFAQAVYLRSHMKSHTGERPYRCEVCNKLYAHRSDLNRHKIIHTGARPYTCDWCGASFADPSSRRRHMRDHNEMRGTYNCHLCAQYFRRFGLLKTHLSRKHNIIEVSHGDANTLKIIGSDSMDFHDMDFTSPKAKMIQGQLIRVLCQLRKAKPNSRYQFVEAPKATVSELLNITRNIRDSGVTVEEQDLAVQLAMNALQAEQESVVVSEQDLPLNQDGTISEHVYLTELPESISTGNAIQIVNEKGDIEYVEIDVQGGGGDTMKHVTEGQEITQTVIETTENTDNCLSKLPTTALEMVGEDGETQTVDVVEIDENVFQMHYDQQPDLESNDYCRWLETFVELCKCWSMPLEVELYEKVTHVHKLLLDALATPKGRLSEKSYYEFLSSHCGALGSLITQHLAAVLTNMNYFIESRRMDSDTSSTTSEETVRSTTTVSPHDLKGETSSSPNDQTSGAETSSGPTSDGQSPDQAASTSAPAVASGSGIDAFERLLERQRRERMFELRRLKFGDRPVTGQDHVQRLDQFFSGENSHTNTERPQPVQVEISALVERRPVTSLIGTAAIRRRLEAALVRRSAGAPPPSSAATSTAATGTRAGAARPTPAPRPRLPPRPESTPPAPASGDVRNQPANRLPRPAPANHSLLDAELSRRLQERRVRVEQDEQDGADADAEESVQSAEAGPSVRRPAAADGPLALAERDRDEVIHHIHELLEMHVVSSALEGEIGQVLEHMVQRHARDRGMDGARVAEFIRSLPPSRHVRNDFSDLDDLSDSLSVVSATAVVRDPSSGAVRKELTELRSEVAQLKRMMTRSLETQIDIQRAIRQEVAAAMQGSKTNYQPPRPTPAVQEGLCLICIQKPSDTVIYKCGHLGLCYACAVDLRHQNGRCPVCRAPISDLIRVYKAGHEN